MMKLTTPADGVRAVGRRGAAGDHFDALDELRRDLVEVGAGVGIGGVRVAGPEAPAVDQHQGALRAEAAQVDGRFTACDTQRVLTRAEVDGADLQDLRERVQELGDIGRALQLDVLLGDDLNRARARGIRRGDARPGHDDLGQHLIAGRFFLLLCEAQACSEPGGDGGAH